jgi:hypothetical protein
VASRLALALSLASLVAAAPVRAGIAEDIEAYDDHEVRFLKACRLYTKLVEGGDVARAREVLAYMERRGPPAPPILTTRSQRILLGALAGDFGFLAELRAPYRREGAHAYKLPQPDTEVEAPPPRGRFCLDFAADEEDDDGVGALVMAFRRHAPRARQRIADAPGLGPEDRALAQIAVSWAGFEQGRTEPDPETLDREGEAFLRAYPATAYRDFLLDTVVVHLGLAQGNLEVSVHEGLAGVAGAASDHLSTRSMTLLGMSATAKRFMFAVHFGFGSLHLRRGFVREGTAWPEGTDVGTIMMDLTVGVRQAWDRHAIFLNAGLAVQQLTLDPGEHPHQISFFSAAVHAGYDLTIWHADELTEYLHGSRLRRGVFLRAQLTALPALEHEDLAAPVRPLVWAALLGVGFEWRALERRSH